MKTTYESKWIAVPDSLAMEYAHKIIKDEDSGLERYDNALYEGGFNGRIAFLRLKDLSKVYFNGWLRIDCVEVSAFGNVEYFVYRREDGQLSWKRLEGYEAKTLDELLSKMEADGAIFDEPSVV